jgi:hypothetical protein
MKLQFVATTMYGDVYINPSTFELVRITADVVEFFTYSGVWKTTDMSSRDAEKFYTSINEKGELIKSCIPTDDERQELELYNKIKDVRNYILLKARAKNND